VNGPGRDGRLTGMHEALLTTRHLFSTAANARHLLESYAESERGDVVERGLDES